MSLDDVPAPQAPGSGSLSLQAELAAARRDHPRAAALLRQALADLPDDGSIDRVPLLLRLAAAEQRAGRIEAAWDACRSVAALGRLHDDGAVLADAALATPAPGQGAWAAVAERHALAEEALRLLPDVERTRRDRLTVLVAATADPWSPRRQALPDEAEPAGPEERFELLRARHESALHVRDAAVRLALAEEMAALTGLRRDEYLAWAALWRAGAASQLGRRLDLDAAALQLDAAVRRLREPVWEWRAATVRAATALLDGDLPRAVAGATGALAIAGADAPPEVGFVDLILRSEIAVRSGRDLERVDDEVREVVAHLPFFAQGWRAQVLLAAGRLEELQEIWRALTPHLAAVPEAPVEWLIAVAGYARIAIALKDRSAATKLMALLRPLDGYQVAGDAQTPNGGPVALLLGRLAAVLDDHRAARAHLTAAAAAADHMHDPYHARLARSALADLRPAADPLSARELEISRLIAEGGSNREIGEALHLSVRTVENHVSHVLVKLDVGSRTGVARWYLRRPDR